MRRFVIVGQSASASADFLLQDLPGSSGRLDVLLRCIRPALMVSHGLRRDTEVYLVLGGGPLAPRILRFLSAGARYLRPDERSFAVTAQKALASASEASEFVDVRPGVAVAKCGLAELLARFPSARLHVLKEGATDLRTRPDFGREPLFVVGDHRGFDEATLTELEVRGALPIGLGPMSVQAEDAVALVVNELDRRAEALEVPNET
jgi:tRNA (pseudouridine54-N1)-methyltransferase